MELSGKKALVTGASRGVGAAVAVALAEAGCDVAVAARSTRAAPQRTPGTLEETVERIEGAGQRGVAVPTNLADPDAVVAMVDTAVDALGGLDIVVNNAAVTFVGDLDIPLSRHELIMAVNVTAPLVATRAARPHLAAGGGGVVVNVSSVAALHPYPGVMSYGISKIALERLTVDCARLFQDDGIAVNCFRIDIGVASEGFVANTPGADRSSWEPTSVAAEGILWMLRQPVGYTGRRESMFEMRRREGIMVSQAEAPSTESPPTELFSGLAVMGDGPFAEPY